MNSFCGTSHFKTGFGIPHFQPHVLRGRLDLQETFWTMPLFRKGVSKPAPSSSLFRSLNDDLRHAAARGDAGAVLELIKKGAKFIPNKVRGLEAHLWR